MVTIRAKNRRGRPPEVDRARRREAALEAALAEIAEAGYARLTMSGVAARAGSSKESLYAWFGSKEAMVGELIRQQAARTNLAVEQALTADLPPRDVLIVIASNLLDLLVGDASLALNRAAMAAPRLAAVLLEHGRHTTGPLVERYLARLHREQVVAVADPAEAFCLLYGLTVADTQIRALLGEPPPPAAERARTARLAVDRFLTLAGTPRSSSEAAANLNAHEAAPGRH